MKLGNATTEEKIIKKVNVYIMFSLNVKKLTKKEEILVIKGYNKFKKGVTALDDKYLKLYYNINVRKSLYIQFSKKYQEEYIEMRKDTQFYNKFKDGYFCYNNVLMKDFSNQINTNLLTQLNVFGEGEFTDTELNTLSFEKLLEKIILKTFNITFIYNNNSMYKLIEGMNYKKNILKGFKKMCEFKPLSKSISGEMLYVLKVIENDDEHRLAILKSLDGQLYTYCVSIYDDIFNYIDEGRIIYISSTYVHFNWIAFDVLNFSDEKQHSILSKRIIEYCYYNENKNAFSDNLNNYISSDNILSNANKMKLEDLKKEREAKIAEMKNKKYKEAIDNLGNKPFEKDGITFTEFTMSYEGIVIDLTGLFSFKKYLNRHSVDNLTDFNTLLELALKTISTYALFPTTATYGVFNGTEYSCLVMSTGELYKKSSITFTIDGKELTIKKYSINDIRINKGEIAECLTHILCHQTLEGYEKFLKIVSKCSLKFHKAISKNIKKYISQFSSTIEIKIERDKNLNYIVVGKNKYQISDTNRLIDTNAYSSYDFANILIETTKIPINKIRPFFKEAEARFKLALKKSEELLKKTIKMFNIKEVTIDGVNGLKVKGKSGNEYLIEYKNNNKVWQIINGKRHYKCIVDRASTNQVGKDATVSRLYSLANDSLVAKDIYTLKV